MTKAAIDLAIKESGWWCRSCYAMGGDRGSDLQKVPTDKQLEGDPREVYAKEIEAHKQEVARLRASRSEEER